LKKTDRISRSEIDANLCFYLTYRIACSSGPFQTAKEKFFLMDRRTVSKLEQKILEAIFEIVIKMGLKKLPLLPSHQTVHLMAKAAVAVYEAAVENSQSREPPQDAQ